jgi:hypothetical protein
MAGDEGLAAEYIKAHTKRVADVRADAVTRAAPFFKDASRSYTAQPSLDQAIFERQNLVGISFCQISTSDIGRRGECETGWPRPTLSRSCG